MTNGQAFGHQLYNSFCIESSRALFSEIQLFRALMRSFNSLRSQFKVEEFHGAKHQVYFNGKGAWGRSPARCELCDVVILSYSLQGGFQSRITFLQAKLSKEKHPSVCSNYPKTFDDLNFKANLEQWDLLARRPEILPVPPFSIHPQLLKDAVLASVGSFGVFHKTNSNGINFFYSSADELSVKGAPTQKHGRLQTSSVSPRRRVVHGLNETTYCCCLPIFGEALYNLEIGTPIDTSSSKMGAVGQPQLRSWVSDMLSYYIEVGNNDSALAREVYSNLISDNDQDREFPESIPSLIIIKSDQEGVEPRH